MAETALVYLNGSYLAPEAAAVSFQDRGFLFADGVYEVIRCYQGKSFRLEAHLDRLAQSANGIFLPPPPLTQLAEVCRTMLARTGLREASLYIQYTRGPAPRAHLFPAQVNPTLMVTIQPAEPPTAQARQEGVGAITLPDQRWGLCHIKAIGLLANILAKEEAKRASAYEALFVKDGLVTEGSSCNVFAVFDGCLHTHPQDTHILAGVTRTAILEAAAACNLPVCEESTPAARLPHAAEIIISSTIMELLAVVRLDGAQIGSGKPGPVYKALAAGFAALAERETTAK